MPYIKQENREQFEIELQNLVDSLVEKFLNEDPTNLPGTLNYLISSLIKRTYIQSMEANGFANPKLNYLAYNEIIGILECAKLEVYRHMAGPYEDLKIKENGDI